MDQGGEWIEVDDDAPSPKPAGATRRPRRPRVVDADAAAEQGDAGDGGEEDSGAGAGHAELLEVELGAATEARGASAPDERGSDPERQPDGPDTADPEAAGVPANELPVDDTPTEDVTRGPGPGADLSDDELQRRLAALLFASPEPLSIARLVSLLERPPAARVRAAVESLGHALEAARLPLQVRGLRGGYTLMTVPELGQVVARLAKGPTVERISGAALETLAIVAYRQPVTKAEIESIRGVQAGPILRTLVDRGLVKVVGRADVPGHPLQYGTGKEFLDRFGLLSLEELPRDAELARG